MVEEKQMGKDGEMTLDLSPEVAMGTYANMAVISHSGSEFVIDFARVVPGLDAPKVVSRVVMTPDHTKRFFYALRDNLGAFQEQHGKIVLPEEGQRITIPFSDSNAPEA